MSDNINQVKRKPLPMVKAFFHAARPGSLLLTVISIALGTGLAFSQLASLASISGDNWLVLLLTLWVAMALHVLTNIANDYGDGLKGTDVQKDDVSADRMLARGEVQPAEFERFKKLIYFWAFLTFCSGVALIAIGFDNWHDFFIFLALGLAAIIAAMAYTMGNKPYGYRAMGEVSVLIFFGWVGVLGTAYLQTQQFNISHLLPATGCGGFAACVMYVNNMRDIHSDKKVGKITIPIILGEGRMQSGYYLLVALTIACYLAYAIVYNPYTTIFLIALPLILKHLSVIQQSKGSKPNDTKLIGTQLKTVVIISLTVNALFVSGLTISHMV